MAITESPVLSFRYENDAESVRVVREYLDHRSFVREVDTEEMFNYVTGEWEEVSRFTRDYDLADDGKTLLGDGSNWRGTGRNWRVWFEHRHRERLRVRFPHDEI